MQPNLSIALLLTAVCLTATAPARAGAPLPAITRAMAVRELPSSEAAKKYPVRIRAVVTYVNAGNGELFVQDASAGIFVFIRHSTFNRPLEAGQLVSVEGITAPGDFSTSITDAAIHVLGPGAMPQPIRVPFEHLLTGEEDSQFGSIQGVVRSGKLTDGVLYLNAATTGGTFLVIIKYHPADWARRFIDAKVTLTGVFAAMFNEHRQVSGIRIFIPSPELIHVDDPAPASPFALPQSPALSVGAFRVNADWSRRLRVRASVTAAPSSKLVYVSDGEGNLAAELDSPCAARPGDLLDIAGFPGAVDGRPGLRNSVCRVVVKDRAVSPLEIGAADILPAEAPEAGSGVLIAAGTRHDLKLISLTGTLMQVVRGIHTQTLTVASLDRSFTVSVPDAVQRDLIVPDLGSKLKITGVCLISSDEYHHAQAFRILIRNADDIVVQSRPPWWNLGHALWVIGAMLLSVVTAFGWIAVLRRHVATQTEKLNTANERLLQASLEDALTGAANRRWFDAELDRAIDYASHTMTPLSLIIADIDHFKTVNDLYGHPAGDRCLMKVVAALNLSIASPEGRVLARYGGEEFALILRDTGEKAAVAIAEDLRQAVLRAEIPHVASPYGQTLSISLGVGTVRPPGATSSDDLIGIADRALYRAKQNGRNCVMNGTADAEEIHMTAMLGRLSTQGFQTGPKAFQ